MSLSRFIAGLMSIFTIISLLMLINFYNWLYSLDYVFNIIVISNDESWQLTWC